MAAAAARSAVFAWVNFDNEAFAFAFALFQRALCEDKRLESVDPIEKSLDEQCNGRINGVMAASSPIRRPSNCPPEPTDSDQEADFWIAWWFHLVEIQ